MYLPMLLTAGYALMQKQHIAAGTVCGWEKWQAVLMERTAWAGI